MSTRMRLVWSAIQRTSQSEERRNGARASFHRTSSRVRFQMHCTSSGRPMPRNMHVNISVINLGFTASRISGTFERAFSEISNASTGVSASNLARNSTNGSRKLVPAILSLLTAIAGPGKHLRRRPLVLITASAVGDISTDSNEYSSKFLLMMIAAFWARM